MQELILAWAFGFFCGLIMLAAFEGIKIWSLMCDVYYWTKDKLEHRTWLRF